MAGASSWSRGSRWLLAQEHTIRLVLAVVLTGVVLLTDSDTPPASIAVLLMFGALLISRYAITRDRRSLTDQRTQLSAVALAVLDLFAVTLFVSGTGGAGSGFFALYFICLFPAAMLFSRGELSFLTASAALLYLIVSRDTMGDRDQVIYLVGRLIGLGMVTWYAYVLSEAMRREEAARNQLLRHLTDGVLVIDQHRTVQLVNQAMASFLGGQRQRLLIDAPLPRVDPRDRFMAWLLADVGVVTESGQAPTRVGSFPEAGLPLIECSTITCGSAADLEGWVVVCRDLREQATGARPARALAQEASTPVASLVALTTGLDAMVGYLAEDRRELALGAIRTHTEALRGLIAEMVRGEGADAPAIAVRDGEQPEVGRIAAALSLDPALVAEVSNQVKNDLNVIRGYAELALKGNSGERRERALELAINLSDQAARLVDSLQSAGMRDAGEEPREDFGTARPARTRDGAALGTVVLVVDDDAFMRQLLVDMLEDSGFATASVGDGASALEYLRTRCPALAFVDLSMPGISGVDIIREARAACPNLPVVLMTGYAHSVAMQALGDEKPYALISKPFSIGEVTELVRSATQQAE